VVRLEDWQARAERAESAIREHHAQKSDDRCIEDDDRLYAILGLKCDRRVGSKEEMLKNCARFIERRCEAGGWPTYAELETKLAGLKDALEQVKSTALHGCRQCFDVANIVDEALKR